MRGAGPAAPRIPRPRYPRPPAHGAAPAQRGWPAGARARSASWWWRPDRSPARRAGPPGRRPGTPGRGVLVGALLVGALPVGALPVGGLPVGDAGSAVIASL